MTNPGNPFDGETTPPTNYDGATTPPTAYATSGQMPPQDPKDPNRSKLVGILAVLVVLLLISIGSLLFIINGDDAANGTAQGASQASDTAVRPPATYDGDYLDASYRADGLNEFLEDFDSADQHLALSHIGTDDAFIVRNAFIDRIVELAEDPKTPEVMPFEIAGIDAGVVGEFACKAHQHPAAARKHYWRWDCRGPHSQQVVFYPILMGGIGDTPPSIPPGTTQHSRGTPADPDWKARAIEAKTS